MAASRNDSLSESDEELSYHSSSSEDEPRPEVGVLPYQFEPPAMSENVRESEDSGDEDGGDGEGDRVGNTDWCQCNNCQPAATQLESLCCREVDPAVERMDTANQHCITEVEGFVVNCLNIDVLETSFYEYLATDHGPLGEDEDIHRLYRHVAYRRFTRYIWKLLGKKVRKVIPACAVAAIRAQFPSEAYTNFKYPRP